MTSPRPLPIIAIVGRPNVGKSTLFNRYAGRRRALVYDSPGITRDRIAEEVEVEQRRVLLVDTAGLDPVAQAGLSAAIQAQARAAISDADAVLFLVDGKHGLLPEDEVVARILHRTDKPVLLGVNKIDHPKHAPLVGEFMGLGFERVCAMTAEHGSGCWDGLEQLVAALPAEEQGDEEEEQGIRVAIVGRPNVGKSSLANRLAGAERMVVSNEPGTTRDSIDTRVETSDGIFTFVDTAGLRSPGRRTRIAERGSALMTVRSLERADVALILIDAEEGFTDQDAQIARLARDRGCAAAVLANKWDLIGERATEVREQIAYGLRFMSDSPVIAISAKTGAGVERIYKLVLQVAQAGELRIGTSALNRWLRDVVTRHEPAMAQKGDRRRPLKFFYATQTSVRPPTILLFCTEPGAVQMSYRRFLENRLRESFDLAGTPVRLRLRARNKRA